ncbi:ABC transporter ATP-binding protein [Pleionea sp. CnH1-48]|uniref:ABC transporter ATP-binding protein n=1 Tax=Pleionea sp. CnH1-48 TaxID=2954494 RepID=UPI002096E00C|nr:ABC transporter ATP-binding protein [Pleionea sp. CnH1-48]MCO7226052.1 ABC transporter ATP-binding protein [Pleionea sp. CnH1-48]
MAPNPFLTMESNMLTINNLSKTYSNGVKALNQVTLSLSNGMFGLLGPNGAGKSTLMRTLATLQQPDSGSIQFNDIDLLAAPQNIRPLLGYLPQEFGVYPNVSAQDLLTHFALLSGLSDSSQRRRQIETLLAITNLTQHRKKAVSTFSGGMKQRFGIALALLGNPKLLIVDEPTAGLDPEERNRFHNLLRDVSEETVVILSTHIVEDVSNLCTNMAILNQGTIVNQGSPIELIQQVKGRLWKRTVDKHEVEAIEKTFDIISHRHVYGRSELHILADVSPGEGFAAIDGDLEDVYFANLKYPDITSSKSKAAA